MAFLAAFIAVQWPFADFMQTPEARNWFFGSGYLDFATPARSPLARYEFFYREPEAAQFWRGMGIALLMSMRHVVDRHSCRPRHAKGPAVNRAARMAVALGASTACC